jgi:hypothetical protein
MNYWPTILFFFVSFSALKAQNSPNIEWMKTHPFPTDKNGIPVPQNQTGEDWFYHIRISLNAQNTAEGYITSGYMTYPNFVEDEFNTGGCFKYIDGADCRDFQSPNWSFGTRYCLLTKLDLNGQIVWMKSFREGEFYKVIQTSDGGYLGVGRTQSTRKANGTPLLYNPKPNDMDNYFHSNGSNPNCVFRDNTSIPRRRKMYLCKTDRNGNVEWEYIYGIEPFDNNEVTANQIGSMGWDVAETQSGDFVVVGCAGDKRYNRQYYHNPLSPYNIRTAVWRISANGMFETANLYGSTSGENLATGVTSYPTANGNKYLVVGQEVLAFSGDPAQTAGTSKGFLLQFTENEINQQTPNYEWRTEFGHLDVLDRHVRVTDLTVRKDGKICVPYVYNCSEPCHTNNANGTGQGKVAIINPNNGNIENTIDVTEVRAYDLKFGITATTDGGFAVVSSKSMGKPFINALCDNQNAPNTSYQT